MPAGYVIADIEVKDPEAYTDYRGLSTAAAEKHGGEFLVRGGATETLEGAWQPSRFVIIRFESVEAARRCPLCCLRKAFEAPRRSIELARGFRARMGLVRAGTMATAALLALAGLLALVHPGGSLADPDPAGRALDAYRAMQRYLYEPRQG